MDYAELGNALARMSMFVPVFFLMCDNGNAVTSAFDELDEVVYGMDWYLCPIELQKYLVLMLSVIRQPIVMRGIFSLDCSRFTFKRVN